MNDRIRMVWVGRGNIALAGERRRPYEAFNIDADELVRARRMGRVSSLHLIPCERFRSFVLGMTPAALRSAARLAGVDQSGSVRELAERLVALVDGSDVAKKSEAEVAPVAPKPVRLPIAERRTMAVDLEQSGYSVDEIADELGVSVSTIRNDLRIMAEGDE